MIALSVLDAHAPPLRVMALHALAYCPRLVYLEEVQEMRVADAAVFARLEAEEGNRWASLELTSPAGVRNPLHRRKTVPAAWGSPSRQACRRSTSWHRRSPPDSHRSSPVVDARL